MKKILAFVMAACLSLLLTVPAFADGKGPAFTSYDVVCSKETPYFQENWDKEDSPMEKQGSFPAGTKLTVQYEYERDGVVYGNVEIDDGEETEWVYIRVSDVALKDDTFLPENEMKLAKPRSVRVIGKDGIPLYAGPNKKFAIITTIPHGAKLTYTYGNDEEDDFRTWAYVTYLGRSGWIYVHAIDRENGVAVLPDKDENAQIWVCRDDVKMYDGMSFGNIEDMFRDTWDEEIIKEHREEPDRVLATLEKGKKYTYRYSHDFGVFEYPNGTWYYVTAGLRSGWVFAANEGSGVAVPSKHDEQITFAPLTLKLRQSPDKKAAGVTVDLDRDTVIDPEYVLSEDGDLFYYGTIAGKSGWYTGEESEEKTAYKIDERELDHGYYQKNYSDSAAPIYSDILRRDKIVGEIQAGSALTPLYCGSFEGAVPGKEDSAWHTICYVRCGDVTGWVFEEDLDGPWEEETAESEEEIESGDEQETETQPAEVITQADEDYDDEDAVPEDAQDTAAVSAPVSRSLNPMQIVLVCVGAGAVLALTAVVTLLLIRRKRKAKAADETTITIE